MSNDNQTITQTTTYEAFGNIESSGGSSSNAYKYAGQWGYRNDGDDGLMHVGARYYDPLVGRFLQADSWLGEITRPQSLNRYHYCEGDPVNHVDPTGHDKMPPWGTAAVGAGGLVIGYMIYKAWQLWELYQIQKQAMRKRQQTTGQGTAGVSPLGHKKLDELGLGDLK